MILKQFVDANTVREQTSVIEFSECPLCVLVGCRKYPNKSENNETKWKSFTDNEFRLRALDRRLQGGMKDKTTYKETALGFVEKINLLPPFLKNPKTVSLHRECFSTKHSRLLPKRDF